MIRVLIVIFFAFSTAYAEDADTTYDPFDPCSNETLNPGGESVVKCAYRQELIDYLHGQTLTDDESSELTVSLPTSDSYEQGLTDIQNFYSS